MRKPRDFDSELQALNDKARQLRVRKQQLGELVIACGADALAIEQLAGAMMAASNADDTTKEAWRRSGATFFRKECTSGSGADRDARRSPARDGATPSGSGENGA
jgi:hypothetical protein